MFLLKNVTKTLDSKYFILFIRAFSEEVETQMIWFHWMVCVSIYDLIEWAGLRFTMIGIFIQFQLSDQHSSVMSVKMCRCIILLYGGIMPGGASDNTWRASHHNRANNTYQCVTLAVTLLHCNPVLTFWGFTFQWRASHLSIQLTSYHLVVDLWQEVALPSRPHYLSKRTHTGVGIPEYGCTWYWGSRMRAFCDALWPRFLAPRNIGCQIVAAFQYHCFICVGRSFCISIPSLVL